jgi:DNA-binding response OmpR family regulator
MSKDIKILLVDDEEANLDILNEYLDQKGFFTILARDGIEALSVLEDEIVDIIILDRMMPNMDGMEFLRVIKKDKVLSNIPVIMQTAATSDDEIAEGLAEGVYYYLTKPFSKKVFLGILNAAIIHHVGDKDQDSKIDVNYFGSKLIDNMSTTFRTMEEAKYLSAFIASLTPQPEKTRFGILELTINAIEHGNLAIDFNTKRELLSNLEWESEIKRRLASSKFKSKIAKLNYRKTDKKIIIEIEDEGDGFSPQDYMEIDRNNLTMPNGRGIAMSKKFSFDSLNYNDKGNKVTVEIDL